jgi:hypothetical protein
MQILLQNKTYFVSKQNKKNHLFKKIRNGLQGNQPALAKKRPRPSKPLAPNRYATAAFRMLTGGAHLSDIAFVAETGPNTATP